jgi:hypothetical protein
VKDSREPFPVLAELARHLGVEQYRLAMMIVLLALPLLSMLIAGAVAPFF